jgi:hypothetical protein
MAQVGEIRKRIRQTTGKGLAYELLVQTVQQAILDEKGLNHIQVLHDVEILGLSGQWHQVDVYWEYDYNGLKNQVALECKNYATAPIEVGLIREMVGLKTDVPNLQPIVVTKIGYQSGASTLAQYHNIGLRLVREATDTDYKGLARKIVLEVRTRDREVLQMQPNTDEDWIKNNLTEVEIQAIEKGFFGSTDSIFVHDLNQNSRFSFLDLENQACASIPIFEEEDEKIYEHIFRWENAFLESDNMPALKIVELDIKFRFHVEVKQITIGGTDIAHTLVRDVLENRSMFLDEKGIITGDKENFLEWQF